MSWESCIILLYSDSTCSFYSGDIVTGSVIVEFQKEQKIENLRFKVLGTSKAKWTRSMPTMPYIKIYSEKRVILEYDIDIFSELNGKKIRPGIQTFNFHFLLPGDAPSSFKSSIAEVLYVIKVQEARSKFKCKKITPFTVQSNVNLNHLGEYLIPTFVEASKTFLGGGVFSMCFKTYKGFSSKQYAPFEVILTNNKKVKISKINVILLQKLKYTVASGYANEEKKVFKVEHTKFSETLTERCIFGMEIPQTIPSSIYVVDPMIEISYVFRVEVIFPFHSTLFKDVPVTISTIPVMHTDFEDTEFTIK